MKVQKIRYGSFETNSSSSHSIAIHRTVKLLDDTIPLDEFGGVTLEADYYGWENFTLKTAKEKAEYFATYCNEYHPDTLLEDFTNMLKEFIGANDVKYIIGEDCGIDHQSLPDAIYTVEFMKRCIFGSKNIIYGGNDNDYSSMPKPDVEDSMQHQVIYTDPDGVSIVVFEATPEYYCCHLEFQDFSELMPTRQELFDDFQYDFRINDDTFTNMTIESPDSRMELGIPLKLPNGGNLTIIAKP